MTAVASTIIVVVIVVVVVGKGQDLADLPRKMLHIDDGKLR